jgi:uncharacterized protein YjgD (DUF1641 family)
MVSKLKRPTTEWETILTQDKSPDKGLIAQIYRELKKLNSQIIIDPMKKWANILNRIFSKEAVQMAKKHMMKFSISLALKKCTSNPR